LKIEKQKIIFRRIDEWTGREKNANIDESFTRLLLTKNPYLLISYS